MLSLCLLAILLLGGSASADFPAPPNALTYNDVRGRSYNVTYDSRSFIIDGRRTLLLGGAVHYPRIEPQRWHAVLQHMLDAGMNHVQLYYTPTPNLSTAFLHQFDTDVRYYANDGVLRIGPLL